jgi:hypothetical protein
MSLRTLCAALVLAMASPALSDSPPKPFTTQQLSISAAPAAGSAEFKAIAEAVKGWMGQVTSGDPGKVKEARKELSGSLRKPEATSVFHRLFFEIASPEVSKVLESGDAYHASNALMVIRWVRTPEAFELVRQQCDARRQKDVRIRAAAANLLPAMVDGGCVPPAQLDAAGSRLAELASSETEWVVVAQEMTALSRLASMASEAKMGPQAAAIRLDLIKALGATVKRMGDGSDKSAAPACYRGLIAVRDQVIVMNQAETAKAAERLTPILQQVEAIPEAKGDELSGDELEWRGARKVADTLKKLLASRGGR